MKTDWRPTYRSAAWLVLAGVIVWALGLGVWWTKVHQDSERVFWGMLANNLQTQSVTRELEQTTNQTKLKQTIMQIYGPQTAILSRTNLTQSGSSIETESIGTLGKDYIRYSKITSDQKGKNGKPLDFKPVLNRWASTDKPNNDEISAQQSPALLTEAALGLAGGNLIPFANLPTTDRNELLDQLRRNVVFDVKFDKQSVAKKLEKGRPVYTYKVDVQAVAYAAYEKTLAKKLGIKLLDKLDPNSFQGQPPIKVELRVDAWSHRLVSVKYQDSGRNETYASYGVQHQVVLPQTKLSGQQLQELVNKVE